MSDKSEIFEWTFYVEVKVPNCIDSLLNIFYNDIKYQDSVDLCAFPGNNSMYFP